MPFTPSHAVVALPFIRTRLLPGAIGVGAMSPDLPLFIPFAPEYALTHSWTGMLLVSLPLALLLFALWRILLRPVVAELLPRSVAGRLPADWSGSSTEGCFSLWGGRGAPAPARLSAIALLLVSALLGVFTHIVWDLFTHDGRLGAEWFPAISEQWGMLAGHTWLQLVSSVAGLGVLGIWALLWLRRRDAAEPERALPDGFRLSYWSLLAVAFIAVPIFFAATRGIPASGGAARDLLFFWATRFGLLAVGLTLLACLLVHLRRSRPGPLEIALAGGGSGQSPQA